jgi:DNA polymerase III subunit epsilon
LEIQFIFNDTSLKTKKILDSLYHIDVIETGNELMASLIESREIKKHQPEINKALRKKTHAFLLTAHITHGLYNSFKATEMEWLDSRDEVINHYATRKALTEHIDHLIYKFQLCKKINSQSPDGNPCQAFQLGLCFGACINKETQESYNKRFYEAYHEINKIFKESFYIIAEGRSCDENSVVIVENGYCSYLGYIPKDQLLTNISEMKDYLEIYHGGVETNRMIEFYLKRDQNYKIYYL